MSLAGTAYHALGIADPVSGEKGVVNLPAASQMIDLLGILEEKTQARKSASTSTSKDSELELPAPTLFGRDITLGGYPLFNYDVNSANSFDGEGDRPFDTHKRRSPYHPQAAAIDPLQTAEVPLLRSA